MSIPHDTLAAWWHLWFRCPRCAAEWEDEWDAQVEEDCPACGCRAVTPSAVEERPS